MTDARFDSYADRVDRRRWPILLVAGIVTVIASVLALRLPLRADLSNLLPPEERSVRDLEQIGSRIAVLGLVLCAVESDDPVRRGKAARAVAERIRLIDPSLVATVMIDDGAHRRFAWDNRFLFAPLADLREARDSLAARLGKAKLQRSPLYVPLDEDEDPIDRLRQKLRDAEAKVRDPQALISKDGRVQIVVVQAPFPSASVTQGERLLAALGQAAADTMREIGPGVEIGLTEDVVIAVAEHRAVLDGMTLAVLLTVLIVCGSLLLYFRSLPALLALFGSLAVGTVATFGLTRLTIGHLNSLTAFLSAIVVGNGINFGILVLARHLEERRRGAAGIPALARALGGSFTGTLTAALAAGVAYASLVVTDFRGFRDFGVIGGFGMLLCWISAYTVLPALLAVAERRDLIRPRPEPALGRFLARLLPRRPRAVIALGGAAFLLAGCATFFYLRSDPFEYDWQKMRSDRGAASEARRWMETIDRSFGRQLVGGFVVRAADARQAEATERVLRAHAEDEPGVPAGDALFRSVGSIRDLVPKNQPEKLAVLAEIRRLLDEADPTTLTPDEAAEARRLRPPDDLRVLTVDDVPELLARRYTERDGTRGRLLFANQASRFDGWNGRHMVVFADAVRVLPLPPDTQIGGGAFVFVDVLRAVTRAGPRATLAALLGVVLFVALVVGRGRHAAVTLACVFLGTTLMITGAALLGLKVNFLDFVALPITLGIGVDYAVNVVARARNDGASDLDLRHVLSTTGAAVVLCSWTTTVGYGSLLLSANAGIRSFGLVAILGEATCLLAAMAFAPALLTMIRDKPVEPISRM